MLTFVVILGFCGLVGIGVFFLLARSGLLPGDVDAPPPPGRGPTTMAQYGRPAASPHVPHLYELPQGCLIGIILAAVAWFVAWGVVLYLALRFLRSPFAT